ncbi:MAG: VTT domain-containing protein [Ruminococcus sp.]|nr:VTT domain-containing protein [Oscillospiraceae bacterium]MDY4413050.1 VTT domain-containing protein [Ruminococcus sp.]
MKKKTAKTIATVLIIAVCGVLLYYIIPLVKLIYTEEGRILLDEKIRSFGIFAPLIFIGIEILQIVLAFIPGAPVDIIGGVLFGKLWGSVLCFVGIFTGTLIVFYLVRIFGKPLVEKIFPKEKFENHRFLKNEKQLSLIVFILFLIPGTPKDFLTYISALTDIKPAKFMFITAVARTPAMMCSVIMGNSFFEGNFRTGIILFALIGLLSILGYFIKTKFLDKHEK